MLTRAEIDDILKLIDGSTFSELRLEMGDLKLELRKGPQTSAAPFHLGPNTHPCIPRSRRHPNPAPSTARGRSGARHRLGRGFGNSGTAFGDVLARAPARR